MPRRSEQAEVNFPYGEVVTATGKDARILQILRRRPVISKAELAQNIWEAEIHHPNPFLRVDLESTLSEYHYLPYRISRIRKLLPNKYELGETEDDLLFIREQASRAVENEIEAQIRLAEGLGFPKEIGLSQNQYRKTLPHVIDTAPPKLWGENLFSVLVEPRINLTEQLRLQGIFYVIDEDGSSGTEVSQINPSIQDNTISINIPYYLWVYHGTHYLGGYS